MPISQEQLISPIANLGHIHALLCTTIPNVLIRPAIITIKISMFVLVMPDAVTSNLIVIINHVMVAKSKLVKISQILLKPTVQVDIHIVCLDNKIVSHTEHAQIMDQMLLLSITSIVKIGYLVAQSMMQVLVAQKRLVIIQALPLNLKMNTLHLVK